MPLDGKTILKIFHTSFLKVSKLVDHNQLDQGKNLKDVYAIYMTTSTLHYVVLLQSHNTTLRAIASMHKPGKLLFCVEVSKCRLNRPNLYENFTLL